MDKNIVDGSDTILLLSYIIASNS